MNSEFYPKWLSVVTAVNRATETVTVQEDDYCSRVTLFDLRCLFSRYYGVAMVDVSDFGVRTLRGRKVVRGTVAGKARRMVLVSTVEEVFIAMCIRCRRYVGVLGDTCDMRSCEGTGAVHDLPLVTAPRTP